MTYSEGRQIDLNDFRPEGKLQEKPLTKKMQQKWTKPCTLTSPVILDKTT